MDIKLLGVCGVGLLSMLACVPKKNNIDENSAVNAVSLKQIARENIDSQVLSTMRELMKQHNKNDAGFYNMVEEIETSLNANANKYTLAPKSAGGTSCYLVLQQEGKTIGALIPENGATNMETEVGTFQTGVILGPQFATGLAKGGYVILNKESINKYQQIVETSCSKGEMQRANKADYLVRAKASANGMTYIYKPWIRKPREYAEIINAKANKINDSHKLIQALTHGIQTEGDFVLSAEGKKGSTSLRYLVQELSVFLTIDSFMGQWDRYSGGNFEIYIDDISAEFAWSDNGGASISSKKNVPDYIKYLDKNFKANIVAAAKLINDKVPFGDIQSADDLALLFGIYRAGSKEALFTKISNLAKNIDAYKGL